MSAFHNLLYQILSHAGLKTTLRNWLPSVIANFHLLELLWRDCAKTLATFYFHAEIRRLHALKKNCELFILLLVFRVTPLKKDQNKNQNPSIG